METLMLPIGKVKPSPDNPRQQAGDVTDLATSIKAVGVLEPLIVMPNGTGDSYTIVCGARRYAGAKSAKLKEVPVIVRKDLDTKSALEIMLIENLHREDLNPIEEAESYKRLIEDVGVSQRDLSQRIGRSQPHISKRLSLLSLPEGLQADVAKGSVGLGDAQEYTRIKDDPEALAEAIETRSNDAYRSTKTVVDQILAHAERSKKQEAALAKAEKEGMTVLTGDEWRYKSTVKRVGPGSYDGLDAVKPAQHKKLECHAVGVDYDASLIPLCTKPANHREESKGSSKYESSSGRVVSGQRREHEKQLRQARKDREDAALKLLSKRVPKGGLFDQVVTAFITSANGNPIKYACKLLGIESTGDENTHMDHSQVLLNFADESPDQMARAGLALSCAVAEERINGGWGWGDPIVLGHFDVLEAGGYNITKPEELELQGKAPK